MGVTCAAAVGGSGASAVRFPFRGEERRLYLTVAQAARLEFGRIADLRGERPAAVRAYEALLATLPEPAFDAGQQWSELRRAVAAIDRRGLVTAETLELDFHLAAASRALGDDTDAARRLADLEQRAAVLPNDHWLVRSLSALRTAR